MGIGAERRREHLDQLPSDVQSQSQEHRQQVAVGGLLRDPPRVEQQFPQQVVQWAGGIQRQGTQGLGRRRQAGRERLSTGRGPLPCLETAKQLFDRRVILQDTRHHSNRHSHPEHPRDGRQILPQRLSKAQGIGVGGVVHLQRKQHQDAIDRGHGDTRLPQLVAGVFEAFESLAPLFARVERRGRQCRALPAASVGIQWLSQRVAIGALRQSGRQRAPCPRSVGSRGSDGRRGNRNLPGSGQTDEDGVLRGKDMERSATARRLLDDECR